jgi:hypothetical protein
MLSETFIETVPFTIQYKESRFDVVIENFGPGNTVYLVKSKGGGVFIALTRASGLNDPKFWATIPENIKRHEEAQEIGRLIFRHFNQRL